MPASDKHQVNEPPKLTNAWKPNRGNTVYSLSEFGNQPKYMCTCQECMGKSQIEIFPKHAVLLKHVAKFQGTESNRMEMNIAHKISLTHRIHHTHTHTHTHAHASKLNMICIVYIC